MHINMDLLISNAPPVTTVRAPWGIKYLILSIWEEQILSCGVWTFWKQSTHLIHSGQPITEILLMQEENLILRNP